MFTDYLKELFASYILYISFAGYFAGLAAALLISYGFASVFKARKKGKKKPSYRLSLAIISLTLAVISLAVSAYFSTASILLSSYSIACFAIWAAIGLAGGLVPIIHPFLLALSLSANIYVLFSLGTQWLPVSAQDSRLAEVELISRTKEASKIYIKARNYEQSLSAANHKLTISTIELFPGFLLIPAKTLWTTDANKPDFPLTLFHIKTHKLDAGSLLPLTKSAIIIKDNQLQLAPVR